MKKITEKNTKPKVLFVDDEQDLGDLVETLLGEEGYEVILARNGLEGVKKNEKYDPGLIIMDLKMPKMNGIQALRNIRKSDKDVVAIILTGYASAQTAKEAEGLDVYEYLCKPFDIKVLKKTVKEGLSAGRKRRKA